MLGELAEARQEAKVAPEAARATKDAMWVTKNAAVAVDDNAQDIGLHASFKILR